MKTIGQDWFRQMQQERNQLARENARFSIRTDVSEEESFLTAKNWDPQNKVALEIGCGIGRMTKWIRIAFRESLHAAS